ncbi:MAG: transglutaminaseTgpA domain-containing protein [Bdellovibrio sp.]
MPRLTPSRLFLTALMGLHLLLLLSQVPLWVGGAGLILLLASLFEERFPARVHWGSRSIKKETMIDVVSGLLAAGIFATLQQIFGIETSAALVFVLLPLEMNRLRVRRSQWAFLFLWILALALALLEHQGLLATVLLIFDVAFIFAWMSVFEKNSLSISWSGFRSAFLFVAMSFPIWILIFLVFPRFTVELWGTQGSQGELGFSDKIEPGHLERVVANNQVALRIRFPGSKPESNFSYFRGSVLEEGEGLNWQTRLKRRESPAEFDGIGVEQQIWSSEINGRTLIALDHPRHVETPLKSHESFDSDVFKLRAEPRGPHQFTAWSRTELASEELDSETRAKLTFISPPLREQLEALAKKQPALAQNSGNASQQAERLRDFFKSQKFRYSLSPPTLSTGGVAEFLEQTKVGFCEHFAASTATLLRWQGVPARVVVGFLGGRQDPFSSDLIVMTREAHAWVEAYDDASKTWRRLDPTLWIEPLRLEYGADLFWLPENLREQLWASGASLLPWWPQFQERVSLAWDASVGRGERFVLTYQADWVRESAEKVGVQEWAQPLALIFLLFVGGVMATLLPRARNLWDREDPWLKLWRRFGRKVGTPFGHSYGELAQWQQARLLLTKSRQDAGDLFVAEFILARYNSDLSVLDAERRTRLEKILRDIPSETT